MIEPVPIGLQRELVARARRNVVVRLNTQLLLRDRFEFMQVDDAHDLVAILRRPDHVGVRAPLTALASGLSLREERRPEHR